MIMTVILNMVLLPKFGGTYNQEFLSAAVRVSMIVAAAGIVPVMVYFPLIHQAYPLL